MITTQHYFVDMKELLNQTEKGIPKMLGLQDTLVTPGCAAAISLGYSPV
jgi:hypothetical protein